MATAIDWLDQLVAVPTTPGQANAIILDLILERLSSCAPRVHRVATPGADSEGLILSVGPDVPGGLVLSGHLDVVPAVGQVWTSDPFRLTRRGDSLIGRGTCDMKGFVACALTTLQKHARRNPAKPLHVVLSADEETECRSVTALIERLKAHVPPVRGVLVGEPTSNEPVNRHCESATHHVEISGRAIHASMAPQGADAIAIAAKLVTWLEKKTAGRWSASAGGAVTPHSDLHTVTRIRGGAAVNTVAAECGFDWDMRLVSGRAMSEITTAFDQFAKDMCRDGVHIRRECTAFFPGLIPSPGSRFAQRLLSVCKAKDFGRMPYGTEAGYFQAAGFDVLICGPGDPQGAHVADEAVSLDDLTNCLAVLDALLNDDADI